jgi:NAD(P)H-hydrate epimerase
MILVTANEMQQMDRRTIESFGIPGRVLMENAGRGATRFFLEQFSKLSNKRVGVVAGRGNNGGDGFVIARYLMQQGVAVKVFLLSSSNRVKGDAAANLQLLKPLDIPLIEIPDEKAFSAYRSVMADLDIWIDAILGTGLNSDVKGYFKTIIEFINGLKKPVFAVDIPSGLNSDTGQTCGTSIRASATATFGFAKTGHMIYPGAGCTGPLEIVDIGIPPHIVKDVAPKQFLLTQQRIKSHLKSRNAEAHKGITGHLLVIAGSPGKTGAASMTAMSALRAGAGLVTLATGKGCHPVVEAQVVEAMTEPLPENHDGTLGLKAFDTVQKLISGKKCLAIGPGLGHTPETEELVCKLIRESQIPVVLDADGINSLNGNIKILKTAQAPIILTPHPGEMARLLDIGVGRVQQDRIKCARDVAVDLNIHVVLKGARTVIAHPDGRAFINTTGNPGMASGGMGDVLTGTIAGLTVQGFSLESAVHTGVYLHGAAADSLTRSIGPFGYLATEVMNRIPGEIQKIIASEHNKTFNRL